MVKEYLDKTDWQICMVKPIDGRTLIGLRRNKDELAEHPETHQEASVFAKRDEDIKICEIFHETQLRMAKPTDIRKAIIHVGTKLAYDKWPLVTRKLLRDRQASVLYQNEQYNDVVNILYPFTLNPKWNPLDPISAAISDVSMDEHCKTFVRKVFKEIMLTLIHDGTPKLDAVIKLCKYAKSLFDASDPVELTVAAVNTVKHWSDVFSYLLHIADDTYGFEYKEPHGSFIRPMAHASKFNHC